MNNTQYPYIESVLATKHDDAVVCEMCGKPRTHITTVATTYFKGDNEYIDVCEEHKSDLESIKKLLDYS